MPGGGTTEVVLQSSRVSEVGSPTIHKQKNIWLQRPGMYYKHVLSSIFLSIIFLRLNLSTEFSETVCVSSVGYRAVIFLALCVFLCHPPTAGCLFETNLSLMC